MSASCAASSGLIIAFFHDEICHCICLAMPLSLSPATSETICTVSEASRMENCGLSPQCLASWRMMRTPSAWKVHTVSPPGTRPPMMWATRSCISLAALLVKVIAAMLLALMPHSLIRCAILCVITRVLPLPAPASTRQGPSR